MLAHPLRLRMLSPLTGASNSAMELSQELSNSHPLASYHLRQMHAAGVIELAEVRLPNGGRERRFSYRPDPAQRAAGLPARPGSAGGRATGPIRLSGRPSYRPDPAQRAAGPRPDQESEALLGEAVCVELRRRSGDAVPGAERLGVDAELLWVEPADWQAALDAIRAAA